MNPILGSTREPHSLGTGDTPMQLTGFPWAKELIAATVNVLDEHGIPSLLWGDSILEALGKPTALGVSQPPPLPNIQYKSNYPT